VAKVEIKGFDKLERFIDRMLLKIADTERLMESIGLSFVSVTQERIHKGIEPPNAPLTKAWKKGKKAIPLLDNGHMAASINYRAGKDFVTWGSNKIYAPIQQFGGTIKPKNAKKLAIPAGWHTRRLMRKYEETPKKCIEGLKKAGWKIYFTDGAIMGKPPRKKDAIVLFVRKESVNIPARPFLRFEEPEKEALDREVRRWLDQR